MYKRQDVKTANPAILVPLFDIIRSHRAAERVLLTSFWPEQHARFKERNYEGPLGISKRGVATLLYAPGPFAKALLSRRGDHLPDRVQVPVAHERWRFDTARFVERCHRAGLRVDFWVINDVDTAKHLLNIGADGIMTDSPTSIAPAFHELR